MKTAQATIEILGLGPVEIKTELLQVTLVGALTINGDYVNCITKRVKRNKKAAKAAAAVDSVYLKALEPGFFMRIEDDY